MDISDSDLNRLARHGNPAEFRLLVERRQPMARARAARLSAYPGDVDDIMQESFPQACLGPDRLLDPDRVAGRLAGIVRNVCRHLQRRDPLTLLASCPEPPGRRPRAAPASLHKARLRLRASLTEHRPDLVQPPNGGRT